MKAALFTLAASLFLLTACDKEVINVPEKNARDILVTNGWRLTEQITKNGTDDPFAEVPPEDVTVTTEDCRFNIVVDFLDDGTYRLYGDNPNCWWWGPEEGVTWLLGLGDTTLSFSGPSYAWGYKVEKISELQLLLSQISIGIESGSLTVNLYRFESL